MPDAVLLRLTQREAGCPITGRPCVVGIECGCALEAVAEPEDETDDFKQSCSSNRHTLFRIG